MINRSGFVNIIKPTGMTSSDVVCKVKKILGTKKVGHFGTLDPAASGVLPLGVGKATKFFDYFLSKDKEYIAQVQFGVLTDTLDSCGKILEMKDKVVSADEIEHILTNFIGKIKQIPPKYSAVKINGEKAYDLARQGVEFEIKARDIEIFSIELLKEISKNRFLFKVHCSAGTYIRTLFNDIANLMGTVATTPVIIRTQSGKFDTKTAITLEELERTQKILRIEDIFSDIKHYEVEEVVAKKLINGVKIEKSELRVNVDTDEPFFVTYQLQTLGFYCLVNNKISPIVFLFEN